MKRDVASRRAAAPAYYAQVKRRQRERLRLEVLEHYSADGVPCCNCCGEAGISFLVLDHVNGGGNAHRREIGRGGVYYWVKKRNYPPGFRVLCHNCNAAIAYYGQCPHRIIAG